MEESVPNKFLLPLAVIVAGIMISAAIYFGGSANLSQENNPLANDIEVKALSASDHVVGNPNAEIVIIEYSDTECPFCKTFHNTMKEVVSSYGTDKVAWAYRHFPIASLHAKAIKEAEATECAAELGGNAIFWQYLDTIFETTNSNDSLDPLKLPEIAVSLGLDEAAFNTCLSSGKHNAFILQSVEDAVKAGARGTPYSVILSKSGDKMIINGAESMAKIKIKIDSFLK